MRTLYKILQVRKAKNFFFPLFFLLFISLRSKTVATPTLSPYPWPLATFPLSSGGQSQMLSVQHSCRLYLAHRHLPHCLTAAALLPQGHTWTLHGEHCRRRGICDAHP